MRPTESPSVPSLVLLEFLGRPGTVSRPEWTTQALRPYFIAHDNDAPSPYFRGVILEPGISSRGATLTPRWTGIGSNPTKVDLDEAVNELYTPGRNIPALMAVSRNLRDDDEIRLWITLPYIPVQASHDIGDVQSTMQPARDRSRNRAAAIEEWMRAVLERWLGLTTAQHPHRVVFHGFVWNRGTVMKSDLELIRAIGAFVHQHHLRLMWIKNFEPSAPPADLDLLFDDIVFRVLYLGQDPRGIAWLDSAIAYAAGEGRGIVFRPLDGSKTLLRSALRMAAKQKFAQNLHVFEFPDGLVGNWLERSDSMYQELLKYLRNVNHSPMDGEERQDANHTVSH